MQTAVLHRKKQQNRLTFLPLNKKCITLRAYFENSTIWQIKTKKYL
jgi:hypothetical protein